MNFHKYVCRSLYKIVNGISCMKLFYRMPCWYCFLNQHIIVRVNHYKSYIGFFQ